jgi:hypothetical protein
MTSSTVLGRDLNLVLQGSLGPVGLPVFAFKSVVHYPNVWECEI